MSPEEKKDDREDSDIEQESREENDNEDDTGDRESVATSSSSGSRASGKPKGVLVQYRSKLAPQKRKRVSWPNELVAKVHYFEFDADERGKPFCILVKSSFIGLVLFCRKRVQKQSCK